MTHESNLNRESWLSDAVSILRQEVFKPQGAVIPELRVSVGLPFSRDQRTIRVQLLGPELTQDGMPQVYVHPSLDTSDSVMRKLWQCLWENYSGLASQCNYEPETAAVLTAHLGGYPQSALKLPDIPKQDTKMLKLTCQSCGYIVRSTAKWTSRGLPTCYCGGSFNLETRHTF